MLLLCSISILELFKHIPRGHKYHIRSTDIHNYKTYFTLKFSCLFGSRHHHLCNCWTQRHAQTGSAWRVVWFTSSLGPFGHPPYPPWWTHTECDVNNWFTNWGCAHNGRTRRVAWLGLAVPVVTSMRRRPQLSICTYLYIRTINFVNETLSSRFPYRATEGIEARDYLLGEPSNHTAPTVLQVVHTVHSRM